MRIDATELTLLLEQDLVEAGWDGALDPYPGQILRQFAMSHLRRSLTKKYLPGTSATTRAADEVALNKFTKVNEFCRTYRLDTTSLPSWERTVVGEVKSLIERFFYPGGDRDFILSQNAIISGFGVGPGSSIGADEANFYSKLANSTMTATDQALHTLYVDAISCNPTWRAMEVLRARKMGSKVVQSSRLSFVPKTTETSRTICTEPILNMIFQKGIGEAIERRLVQVFGIDLAVQPDRNSFMARLGSQNGKYGTIDLSSASDSISLALCEEILPSRVLNLLKLCRSPSTVFPNGKVEELHMISSMGNAFTFPLQTMIFAALVCSCYRLCDIRVKHPRGSLAYGVENYSVFGDDIIVDTRAYALVVRMLEVFGFSVNTDKSFNEGPFRESCGHDYFHGRDVRGVYLSHLRDVNDVYSAINRLVRWTARHGVMLTHLVTFLLKRCRFNPIPFDESDDGGVKVPRSMLTKPQYIKGGHGSISYRVSVLSSRTVSLKRPDQVQGFAGWFHNPDGLLIALLAGSIREGSVVLRSNARRAYIRRRHSPRWDFVPVASGENPAFADRWKWSAELHLCRGGL